MALIPEPGVPTLTLHQDTPISIMLFDDGSVKLNGLPLHNATVITRNDGQDVSRQQSLRCLNALGTYWREKTRPGHVVRIITVAVEDSIDPLGSPEQSVVIKHVKAHHLRKQNINSRIKWSNFFSRYEPYMETIPDETPIIHNRAVISVPPNTIDPLTTF